MGNVLRKSVEGPIDGGSTKHRSPNDEYDQKAVHRLIINKKLAPFYEGLTEPQPVTLDDAKSVHSLSEEDIPEKPERRKLFRLHEKRDKKAESPRMKLFMSIRHTECPICFLYYPRNMNQTDCCHQNLCTSCFVNLRRPPSGRTMSCPFCNKRDFGVKYKPPSILIDEEHNPDGASSRKHKAQAVKSESIRPYQPPSLSTPSAAYRAATTHHAPYVGPPFTVRSGSRATTYGGGVLVMYNERGTPIYYPQPARQQAQRSVRYEPYRPGYAYQQSSRYPGNYGSYRADSYRYYGFSHPY